MAPRKLWSSCNNVSNFAFTTGTRHGILQLYRAEKKVVLTLQNCIVKRTSRITLQKKKHNLEQMGLAHETTMVWSHDRVHYFLCNINPYCKCFLQYLWCMKGKVGNTQGHLQYKYCFTSTILSSKSEYFQVFVFKVLFLSNYENYSIKFWTLWIIERVILNYKGQKPMNLESILLHWNTLGISTFAKRVFYLQINYIGLKPMNLESTSPHLKILGISTFVSEWSMYNLVGFDYISIHKSCLDEQNLEHILQS